MDPFLTMTDLELLCAARDDPQAFGAFYRRHAVPVESITLNNSHLRSGWTTYIAAEKTPSGVRLTLGSTAAALPSCMSSHEAPPVIHVVSTRSGGAPTTG